MVLAFVCGMAGLVTLVLGGVFILAAFMPKYGGGDDRWALPVGLVFSAVGIALLFAAGTLT